MGVKQSWDVDTFRMKVAGSPKPPHLSGSFLNWSMSSFPGLEKPCVFTKTQGCLRSQMSLFQLHQKSSGSFVYFQQAIFCWGEMRGICSVVNMLPLIPLLNTCRLPLTWCLEFCLYRLRSLPLKTRGGSWLMLTVVVASRLM